MPSRARILIIDDHAIVRQGLSALLMVAPDLEVVGEAGSFDEALKKADELRPDLAVIDLTLKDRSGLELIQQLRQRQPELRMLVLSMHDEEEYAERALKAGASGYVMKEKADEVVIEALRTIHGGSVYLSTEVSSRMMRQFTGADEPTGIPALTEREREIFLCMGRGWSTRRIAEQYELSARTVEVHRARIKRKLQCDDLAQLLREAIRYAESQPV